MCMESLWKKFVPRIKSTTIRARKLVQSTEGKARFNWSSKSYDVIGTTLTKVQTENEWRKNRSTTFWKSGNVLEPPFFATCIYFWFPFKSFPLRRFTVCRLEWKSITAGYSSDIELLKLKNRLSLKSFQKVSSLRKGRKAVDLSFN